MPIHRVKDKTKHCAARGGTHRQCDVFHQNFVNMQKSKVVEEILDYLISVDSPKCDCAVLENYNAIDSVNSRNSTNLE